MPSPASTSPSASPSGAGSRESTCSAMSTITASPPSRRTAWPISTPTGPPPRINRRRGISFIEVTSRLLQTPSSSRRPGTGGTTGSAPFARTIWSAVWRTPSTSTTPGPASRPVPRSRPMPLSASQRSCPASEWSETMKSRQARAASTSTSARRRCLARAVDRLAGPQQRLGGNAGPVGALAADQLTLDDRDAQAALGQRARAVLAGRAASEHDHVVVAHRRQLLAGALADHVERVPVRPVLVGFSDPLLVLAVRFDARRIAAARSSTDS